MTPRPLSQRLAYAAREAILPTLSGVMYFLSWIGFGLWPLAFVCFIPLLYSLRHTTPRQALRRGAWMGFITHSGGYTWIVHLLKVFAFLPTPIAIVGYLGICAAQGFIFGVFAWVLRHAWLKSRWAMVALVPLVLCLDEWLYPLLFQSYTGVALMPVPQLIQIADVGGVLLVSGLQSLINGGLADALLYFAARRDARLARLEPAGAPIVATPIISFPFASLVAVILAAGGAFAYGAYKMVEQQALEKAAPKLQIGITQPNVGEVELHQNPMASVRALWNQTAELQVRGASLVVWPEAGFDVRIIDLARKNDGKMIADGIPVTVIAGLMRGDRHTMQVWNSAVVIGPDGLLGDHYDKIALLAFGEYIPFGDTFPILYKWSPMAAPLARGETTAPLRVGAWLAAASICYEGILPRAIARTMEDHGQGRANLLVNLTNDSWYGTGHEQEEHLMLAVMRTIEHRRWLARATSTGVSAFADSMGRVVQTIARDKAGVAMQTVPMLNSAPTLYERLGDWPGYLSLAALAVLFIAYRKRPRTP